MQYTSGGSKMWRRERKGLLGIYHTCRRQGGKYCWLRLRHAQLWKRRGKVNAWCNSMRQGCRECSLGLCHELGKKIRDIRRGLSTHWKCIVHYIGRQRQKFHYKNFTIKISSQCWRNHLEGYKFGSYFLLNLVMESNLERNGL